MNAKLFLQGSAARRLHVATILCALLALASSSLAADDKVGKTAPEKSAVESLKTSPAQTTAVVQPDGNSGKPRVHALPQSIEEVVKMVEAGVSEEIVRGFVNSSGIAYAPTGADIIAMKERGVPDEVTVTMLSRGAKLRERTGSSRNSIAAPAIVRSLATDGRLDPESYEFFWYHHAYPRALSASYEKLSPYVQTSPYSQTYSRHPHNRVPYRTDGFPKESFAPGQKNQTPSGR